MKVKILKQTSFMKEGQELLVDEATAKRWIRHGIAEQIIEEDTSLGSIPDEVSEVEEVEETAETEKELTNKELFELCKEKEIELDKKMINGKSAEDKRAYLMEMLAKAGE